jgi:hypothetical protein
MRKKTTLAEVKAQFELLLPLPVCPGEREWLDRLRTWDDFQVFGLAVLSDIRSARPQERRRLIRMCPRAWNLLEASEFVLRPSRG